MTRELVETSYVNGNVITVDERVWYDWSRELTPGTKPPRSSPGEAHVGRAEA
jgi:hypothetical protein